ncbi:hypothetical protein OG21DRAFT_1466366 [Imleria badia]|nr:hypothetical protein OG21DRAFT_1466366 [Imleria badia]
MHHALCIEEILLHIFSYCYTHWRRWPSRPPGRQCWYANVHLAALARTCRAFKEPALDMIWDDLNDLTPLVRCLPESSWVESEGIYSLQKRLEQPEWDIILGYAHRVRALPCISGSSGLAGDCIEALCNPPTSIESIFPNLRVVGLDETSATLAPLIRHLTNPKLTAISLDGSGNLGAVIDTFAEKCPSVASFHVWQWANADTISGVICRWNNLCSVQCYDVGLNVDALSHLSRLRHLLHMSFKVHDAVVDRMPAAAQSSTFMLSFSALHDLYLASDSLTPIWRLLHHFRLPVIHDLSVALHAHPTAPDLMSFFVAFREACTHHDSLNKLSLRVYGVQNQSDGSQLANASPYHITFDRLRPLTVFVNIKSITLDIPCGADLNERELLRLASSWPHLESFEVGENHDWTTSSALTPGGFLQLLERCRSLRVLYFMFDTRGYTEIPQGHPWRGLTMPNGTFLHLLNSPIEEESIEALGVFFHVAPYPDFSLTTHWNNRYFRGSERPQELCDLYYNRWVEARSLARDLWEKRRDLRRAVETQSSSRQSQ